MKHLPRIRRIAFVTPQSFARLSPWSHIVAIGSFAFLLTACGDTINEQVNVGAVATNDDLPECTESIAGQTAFIKETHEFLGCDGKEWQTLSANTVSVGDNVCTSTSLSDVTGFEIFCNGESIGTVKNGKDGEKGEKGDKGDDGAPGTNGTNGKDGAPGTNGTNGTNGKDGAPGANGAGCKIQESTALTATIACGSETFTMDLSGYVEQAEECDAEKYEDCTGSLENVDLSGVSQKGPFVIGTDITAYELENGRSLKQTGKTFGGKIEKADGTFDIKTVKLKSTFAYIVADGFYRNEVTGRNSASTIKLRAFTNLQGRSSANINLVTHLEYDRVQYLVTRKDSSVAKAKMAAEKEIFKAFYIDNSGFGGFAEDFNILQEGDGNAALLAISALLQGDRDESQLTALLASLSVDLGDNGEWDNELLRAQIADWAMKKDLEGGLAKIRANVEGWKLSTSKAPAFEAPFRNFWMKELGVGECDENNPNALFAIKNENSSYYAANDSAFTAGDSSLVRLICDASGETPAWRFATDTEKDIAALSAELSDGAATTGSINTGLVYVKENGNWRRGTELDRKLQKSCVTDSIGVTDSMTVDHETNWFICSDDLVYVDGERIPAAWRKATTAEADTAGFGVPAGDDPIVRMGNENKSLYYVYEDTSGNGDYVWRYGTDLDYDDNLGPCTRAKVGNVGASVKGKYYKCVDDLSTHVEGKAVPTEWREATNYEKDTDGLEGEFGDYRHGKVNQNLYYVREDGYWRPATDLEMSGLEACTENQKNKVSPIDAGYYKCTNDFGTVVDTFLVEYTWRTATDIEKDVSKLPSSAANGTVRKGPVNPNLLYVFQNGEWRYGTALDTLLGEVCMKNGDTSNTKFNNLYYVCTNQVASDTIRKWVVASDIYNDTYEARGECTENGKYGDGSIMVGRVYTHLRYVCDNGEFRLATSDEIDRNRACVGYNVNHIYKWNGEFYKCTENGWIVAADKETGIVKDAAGQEYRTVMIGSQYWMAENLNYETDSSFCYSGNASNCETYGRLYTWKAAMHACMDGWHVPSYDEITEVLEGENDSMLSILKAGYYQGASSTKIYTGLNSAGRIWSSSRNGQYAYYISYSNSGSSGPTASLAPYGYPADRYSVRCIMDD